MEKIELHEKLFHLIVKHGEPFPKKHGNWFKYQITPGRFFELDSWNKGITYKEGDGIYEEWTGFKGRSLIYYGINFGGFSSNASVDEFNDAIGMIEYKEANPSPPSHPQTAEEITAGNFRGIEDMMFSAFMQGRVEPRDTFKDWYERNEMEKRFKYTLDLYASTQFQEGRRQGAADALKCFEPMFLIDPLDQGNLVRIAEQLRDSYRNAEKLLK